MRLNRNENFSNATNKKGSKTSKNQKSSQLKFAPELITSIREYRNQEPPNFIAYSNLNTPLYQAKNFTLNEKNGQIIRQSNCTSNQDLKILLKTVNVLLESLKIEKYHLNGSIICSKLSSDQSCYIRVSHDNWTTFQETQAVLVQGSKINENIRRFCFDFILPVPKNENLMNHFGQNNKRKNNRLNVKRGSIDSTESGISVGSCSTVTSQDSSSSSPSSGLKKNSNNNIFQKHLIEQFGFSTGFHHGLPQNFEICVVMRNKNMLFYDFNDGGGGYGIELVEQDGGGGSYQIC